MVYLRVSWEAWWVYQGGYQGGRVGVPRVGILGRMRSV